jgi:hypothetical protein
MVSSSIDIDKHFIVRVKGFMPQDTPVIGVSYVCLFVKAKAPKPAHANLLCIGIGDGHNTLYISAVVDSEYIRKHRDLMATSNLNGFKFGIYFIFDDGKGNKKVYLFDQPFDPEELDELRKEKNDQEAIDYFYTKFDGKCSKLKWGKDENGVEVFWLVYHVEGEAKELDFKEENGKITILGFKQTGESGSK